MVINATSTFFGNSKFSSRTSISKTSAPRERNALETPRAVASETSRSEPGPPIKTAIFSGIFIESSSARNRETLGRARLCYPEVPIRSHRLSRVFPHDLHLGFKLDSTFLASGGFNLRDQFQHFRRGRAAVVDDKVSVHLRNPRFANGAVLQAKFVH